MVAALSRTVDVASGQRMLQEGEPAEHCWVIRSGHVALETTLPGGGRSVVQTLGPGDVLGLSWLVAPYHWRFTATATEPVVALELDATELRRRFDADPALGYPILLGLFEAVLARLHGTRARVLDLYGNPRDR